MIGAWAFVTGVLDLRPTAEFRKTVQMSEVVLAALWVCG
jgi:hypothetical protein